MSTRAPTNKTPPYSIAAEKAVLGTVLATPSSFGRVREIVGDDPKSFFRDEHVAIYRGLLAVCTGDVEPPADARSLLDAMAEAGFEHPDKQSDLRALTRAAVEERTVEYHARMVSEKARRRVLISVVSDLIHDVYYSDEPLDDILTRASDSLATV